jgi:hypothetical protein
MSDQKEFLDYGLVEDIPKSRALCQQLLRFHWEFYSELAFLRNQVYESLKSSVRERAIPFQFSNWRRAVKYKYSLEPLGTKGSLVDPGGRFNIGNIDTTRFTPFPALYVAYDKGTVLAELLGRVEPADQLAAEELALTNPASVTIVSITAKSNRFSIFASRIT